MNDTTKPTELLVDGVPYVADEPTPKARRPRWKKRLGVAVLTVAVTLVLPTLGHAQFLSVFDSIFSSIQSDIGSSLSSVNQIMQQVTKISSFRNQMNQIVNTSFTSAVTPGPQQFESILHSRLATQIPSLQASFTSNYGAVPQVNSASPQDRVMMDMDDALGQQNLKTTLVADQGQDLILQTANQMENQVAVSTPGSNPYLTAQAQVANLRCQAYMQMMLAAELRQEAGRIAHDNVLVKRRTTATGGINSLITGTLTR
jgi:hypothetical protein